MKFRPLHKGEIVKFGDQFRYKKPNGQVMKDWKYCNMSVGTVIGSKIGADVYLRFRRPIDKNEFAVSFNSPCDYCTHNKTEDICPCGNNYLGFEGIKITLE